MFFSTINRNPKSFVFAIVGAEYVLKLLPSGTHEYDKFIRPSELEAWARDAGLELAVQHWHALQPACQGVFARPEPRRQLPDVLPATLRVSSLTQMQDGYFDAVLFDLDGTLVDTAPDMVAVLQAMQEANDLDPDRLRSVGAPRFRTVRSVCFPLGSPISR